MTPGSGGRGSSSSMLRRCSVFQLCFIRSNICTEDKNHWRFTAGHSSRRNYEAGTIIKILRERGLCPSAPELFLEKCQLCAASMETVQLMFVCSASLQLMCSLEYIYQYIYIYIPRECFLLASIVQMFRRLQVFNSTLEHRTGFKGTVSQFGKCNICFLAKSLMRRSISWVWRLEAEAIKS